MAANGSSKPIFETDDKLYVLVTLPIHEKYQEIEEENDQAQNQAGDQAKKIIEATFGDKIISVLNFIKKSLYLKKIF